MGLERVRSELREEVSGHSSVSDVDSDSDSPTEVSRTEDSHLVVPIPRARITEPSSVFLSEFVEQRKLSLSTSDEDSDSSPEEESGSAERQEGSGHLIELDPSAQELRHKHKPLKR